MKNKKLIYILIPLVVLVWGLVGYRIIKQVKPDKSMSYNYRQVITDTSKYNMSDTLRIINNYPDPFLKRSIIKRTKSIITDEMVENTIPKRSANELTRTRREERKTVNQTNWPAIDYKGMIVNSNSKTKTALLTINSKERLLTLNSTYEGLELVQVTEDSISVKFGTDKKTFFKK